MTSQSAPVYNKVCMSNTTLLPRLKRRAKLHTQWGKMSLLYLLLPIEGSRDSKLLLVTERGLFTSMNKRPQVLQEKQLVCKSDEWPNRTTSFTAWSQEISAASVPIRPARRDAHRCAVSSTNEGPALPECCLTKSSPELHSVPIESSK